MNTTTCHHCNTEIDAPTAREIKANAGAWMFGEITDGTAKLCTACHNANHAAFTAWRKAQPKVARTPRTVNMSSEYNQLCAFLAGAQGNRKAARLAAK